MYKENDIVTIKDDKEFSKIAQYCNDNGLFLERKNENTFVVLKSSHYITEEEKLDEFRFRREIECFKIINRGQLWYNTLTEEKIEELNKWYKDWLDVTETKVVPQKPTWLE